MTDVQAACFTQLGEAAAYTPSGGGASTPILAIIDEPTEAPFPRDVPRSAFRERSLSIWLPRFDENGAAFSPAKDGTVAQLDDAGATVRTITLVSVQASEPDRVLWACREAGA